MEERILVGQGKVAKIYLIDGMAYKTFSDTHPLDWIRYEMEVQNEIKYHTNLPVLAYQLTSDHEIKMPYIKGVELAVRMRKEKYQAGLEDLITLQQSVYMYKDLKLSNAHDTFKRNIIESSLDDAIKEKALHSLSKIPVETRLCHFDFHFSNIMYDGTQYYILDWVNAQLGNPILDVIRTYIILKQYAMPIADKYLKLSADTMNIPMAQFKQAMPIMAALRMLEADGKIFYEPLLKVINEYKLT